MAEDAVDYDAIEREIIAREKGLSKGVDYDAIEEEIKARESAESRSTLGDIVSGAVRSVAIEAPSMALDVAKATEGIARRMVDLPERGPIGEFATETKEDIQAYADRSPFLRAKEAQGSSPRELRPPANLWLWAYLVLLPVGSQGRLRKEC